MSTVILKKYLGKFTIKFFETKGKRLQVSFL